MKDLVAIVKRMRASGAIDEYIANVLFEDLDYKGIPSPIYSGDNLTKKGTVNKVNPKAAIFGNEGTKLINIKEITS